MLQSFIGTFDAAGLRTLRSEEAESSGKSIQSSGVPFWAILDSKELPSIQNALLLGHRCTAFELLARGAKSLGRYSE